MAKRLVHDIILDPHGDPDPGFQLNFRVNPSAVTVDGLVPPKTVTVFTEDDGTFAVDLVTNVRCEMDQYAAWAILGRSTSYPAGTKNVPFVVPDGDGPISLRTILASQIPDPADATLPNLVAAIEDALNEHEADDQNPHSVRAEQLPDFDAEVSESPNVVANTDARHTHDNMATLDATTAAYTTEDEAKLDGLQDALDAKVPTSRTVNGHPLTSDVTVSKSDVGLGNVANTAPADLPVSNATQGALDAAVSGLSGDIGNVNTALNNAVDTLETSIATKANTTDVATAVSGLNTAIGAVSTDLTAHANNHENPHNVTKAQVELGNVDNTADADKPVSAPQQTALDGKADKVHTHTQDDVTGLTTALAAKLTQPSGGAWYQIMRRGDPDPVWADPYGTVVPDLILTPAQSASRDGLIVPTIEGPQRLTDGRFGDAWWVEIGTTNDISNPSFETGITGFAANNPGNTITHDASVYYDGNYSLSITHGPGATANSGAYSRRGTVRGTTGELWTASAFVLSPDDSTSTLIEYQGSGGTSQYIGFTAASPQPPSPSWRRYSFSLTIPGGGPLSVEYISMGVAVVQYNPSSPITIHTDAWQLEEHPFATSFTLGTRAEGRIRTPYIGSIGTILIRYTELGVPGTAILHDVGTFGQYGTIDIIGGELVIGTTREVHVEGVAVYADTLPADTAAGLLAMPQRWTFGGMIPSYVTPVPDPDPLPTNLMGFFPPNKTIASGGAGILRTAPGTTAPTITTLATSTAVHDTGQRITASSVSYALIMTTVGQGWVPATALN